MVEQLEELSFNTEMLTRSSHTVGRLGLLLLSCSFHDFTLSTSNLPCRGRHHTRTSYTHHRRELCPIPREEKKEKENLEQKIPKIRKCPTLIQAVLLLDITCGSRDDRLLSLLFTQPTKNIA